jgi:chemotaxis signal transduction protein
MPKVQQKFITMTINDKLYAMPVLVGTQFIACNHICPVPKISNKITGLFYYHGKIITVFDIRKILSISAKQSDNKCFMWYWQDNFYGFMAGIGKGVVNNKKVFADKNQKSFKKYIKINNKKVYILEPEQIFEQVGLHD